MRQHKENCLNVQGSRRIQVKAFVQYPLFLIRIHLGLRDSNIILITISLITVLMQTLTTEHAAPILLKYESLNERN
jgi:hypothetical protein